MSESATATNGMSPEEFLQHYRRIKDTDRTKKEAAAAHKAAREAFKSAGGDLNALKIVDHLNTLDSSDAILRMRETMRYAAWLDLEIGTQTEMFSDAPVDDVMGTVKAQHAEWAAEQAGYKDGLEGAPIDNNPFAAGSPHHPRWRAGWHDGQAALAARSFKPEEDQE